MPLHHVVCSSDSGVLIDGCYSPWSASKAVLILAAQMSHFRIMLADVVDSEVRAALVRKGASLAPERAQRLLDAYVMWRIRVDIELWPFPSSVAIARHRPIILPVLRHMNDLAPAISAIEVAPDWVLSTNDAHWGTALAGRTGLRVAHPAAFLDYLAVARPYVAPACRVATERRTSARAGRAQSRMWGPSAASRASRRPPTIAHWSMI